MEIITTSSRGQVVIPEEIRRRHNIKKGTKLILIEKGDLIILENADRIKQIIDKKIDFEEKGWDFLAKESLKEVWDNEKDDKVWRKYL